MISIVRVNALDPHTGLLLPFLTQRLLDFARQHVDEMEPTIVVRQLLARLVSNPENICLLAFVAGSREIVGHACATVETDGANVWIFVSQCRVDPGEGSSDATLVRRAILYLDEWAKSRGLPVSNNGTPGAYMVMSTSRSDDAWRRRYNFKTLRHLMSRPLGSPVGEEKAS